MNWIKQLNEALGYIEEHLQTEIDSAELARCAHLSPYQFQKIFSCLANGLPLSEYIRNRRLSCAADDLRATDEKIIEIALRYGYDSPAAFSRAFKNFHGISPSALRSSDSMQKTFPPIAFHMITKGAIIMDYTIKKQAAFRGIGAKITTTMEDGQNKTDIAAFWQKIHQDERLTAMLDLYKHEDANHSEPFSVLGVCMPSTKPDGTFEYWILVPSKKAAVPLPLLEEIFLPEATYACFACRGPLPEAIHQLYEQIYSDWLPSSGYTLGNAPDIEVTSSGNTNSANYYSEVWIPIKKA